MLVKIFSASSFNAIFSKIYPDQTQVDIKNKFIKDEVRRGEWRHGAQSWCSLKSPNKEDSPTASHKMVKDKHTGLADKLATAEELLQSTSGCGGAEILRWKAVEREAGDGTKKLEAMRVTVEATA
ncbi:hypothetical protein B0H11DRAFT_2259940 [Mycena galericulata]|nr:hypothetical protein B0H11DRAFT_2259940 [Mycena galericulata]